MHSNETRENIQEEENDRVGEYWMRGEQLATLNQLGFNDVESHLFYRSSAKAEHSVLRMNLIKTLSFNIVFGK